MRRSDKIMSKSFFMTIINIGIILCILCVVINAKGKWDDSFETWNSLMKAAYIGDVYNIEKLCDEGVNINNRYTVFKYTALEIAIRAQQYESVKVLLENGADVDIKNGEGLQPLAVACSHNNIDIIKELIEYGADINAENQTGWTPLLSATVWANTDIMVYIINNGADINHQRKVDGMTALHLAIYNGKPEKVKVLLHTGADVNIENYDGCNAFDINNMANRENSEVYLKINALLCFYETKINESKADI